MTKKRKRSSGNTAKGVYMDADPISTSEDYFNDEIDNFHNSKDNHLISEGASFKKYEVQATEEVFGVASDSEDDDERVAEYEKKLKRLGGITYKGLDDDSSDNGQDNDVEYDMIDSDVDDEDLEEHEALNIQKDSMKYLNEDDFIGFSSIQESLIKCSKEKITKGDDNVKEIRTSAFKQISEELKFQLNHLVTMLNKSKEISDKQKAKAQLIIMYCMNLNFFITMNLDQEIVHNHPVVGRICHLKKTLENFEDFLKSIKSDDPIVNDDVDNIDIEEDGASHRPINKTIIQNRGKLPYRNKKLKNPRVRHRKKYRDAKVKRKGHMAEPRKEIKKYQGELTGINPGIIRSVKFK